MEIQSGWFTAADYTLWLLITAEVCMDGLLITCICFKHAKISYTAEETNYLRL